MSPAYGSEGALDPERNLPGRLVVVAPHMDDELIGCGALLGSLADPSRASVIYATDGAGSPAPAVPWVSIDREALVETRREEALAGLEVLGVPAANAHFLELPDGRLRSCRTALREALASTLSACGPAHVLIPFRMDRHPDHLAVHRAVRDVWTRGAIEAGLHEYFVYSEWKLLPGGDIRSWIRPELLGSLRATEEIRLRKRRALELHKSQTTLHFAWQRRPSLGPGFLDRVCSEAEAFLSTSLAPTGSGVFKGGAMRIHAAHTLEPVLKRAKDRFVALVRA